MVSDAFCVAIVIGGQGRVVGDVCEQLVKRGDALFLPAAVGPHRWEARSGEKEALEIITCHPPRYAAPSCMEGGRMLVPGGEDSPLGTVR